MRGTFLGVPMIRTIEYWGLYWVPPILGNLPCLKHCQLLQADFKQTAGRQAVNGLSAVVTKAFYATRLLVILVGAAYRIWAQHWQHWSYL